MTDDERLERPPLVLIANDQEWSARSLESILGPQGYAVLRAYTGRQALERARVAQPDLVILDAQLPDITGIEVCQSLRDDPRFSDTTPILITTAGSSGRAQRLEAYRAGAWEFLGQPLDGQAFLAKVETFLRCKLAVDRVRDQSLIDQGTGLYNMRGLARRAREIGSVASRQHHALACVVFSPAWPKEGAEGLDGVCETIGQAFRRAGRASDAIGRLGPAEFAVIAPATSADGVERLVTRLREALASQATPRGPVRLRAGYCAIPDFGEATLDAVEVLLRATTALRQLADRGEAEVTQAFTEAATLN